MAELAALGLASNIVQFVDFGIKLFSEGRDIYDSAHGSRIEDFELETVTFDLEHIAHKLHATAQPRPRYKPPMPDEVALQTLAASCETLATELLELLDSLKVKGQHHRKWQSFRQALRHARKEEKIIKLEERLQRFQRQIATHLLVSLSSQESKVASAIETLRKTNTRLEANTIERLDKLTYQLIEVLEALDRHPTSNRNAADTPTIYITANADVPGKLEALSQEGNRISRQQDILASLCFGTIAVRHSAIKTAHVNTFKWTFSDSQIKYKQWLETGNGIYWIQGKAGSGKSTLMRYLAEHQSTKLWLTAWAAPHQLSIASHFFWSTGSLIQKSQQGLLQTLLYQVLGQFPDLIPGVCPDRWTAEGYKISQPWSLDELLNTFGLLAEYTLGSAKLCFFIDGLDEYEGNPSDLIVLIRNLASSPAIKLCVSSRPWNPFIRAFDNSEQQLRLEDLTRDDISNYVRSKLQENSRFRELQLADPQCVKIVADLVQRAQGVFLWVYLVVDSLLRGLDEGDDSHDLRARLESLPTDLEPYFRHMLNTIDSNYRWQTYTIFQSMMHTTHPLPILAFWYLEKEKENPNYALEVQVVPPTRLKTIQDRMKQRLNARCKDLIEFYSSCEPDGYILKYKVDFLHRTVRDFLVETNALEEMMKGRTATKFDPHLSLCRNMLALTKTLCAWGQETAWGVGMGPVLLLADELMYHAWQFERSYIHQQIPINDYILTEVNLLDELDHVLTKNSDISSLLDRKFVNGAMTEAHWENSQFSVRAYGDSTRGTFVATAIEFKLLMYVQHKLDNQPKLLQSKNERPLLDYALRPAMVTKIELRGFDRGPDVEIVRLLLEKGANPNQSIYIDSTVWSMFLRQCYRNDLRYPTDRMYDLFHLLINSGADLNIDSKRNGYPLSKVFSRVLRESEIARLNELLTEKRLPRKRRSRFTQRLQRILGT